MNSLQIRFLGSGDAFGSGGCLQPCILVQSAESRFLIDCGTTAQLALRRYGVDPNTIDTILLSHLHGDHFGGLPFFILAAQLVSKRTAPLTIAGPAGTGQKFAALMELMFPGSTAVKRPFAVDIVELTVGRRHLLGAIAVTPWPVVHTTADESFALRIECAGRVIAYSGDGEWGEGLAAAGQDADLLIAEAYYYDKKIKYHLDYRTLAENLPAIRPRRLMLTHMSDDMLAKVDQAACEWAADGKTIEL
jgi:ribonuclease BN (tRNA processing enzyme)